MQLLLAPFVLLMSFHVFGHENNLSPSACDTSILEKINNVGVKFKLVDGACTRGEFDELLARLGAPCFIQDVHLRRLSIPLVEILQQQQALKGQVVADCAMFAQFAALILTERAHSAPIVIFDYGKVILDFAPFLLETDFAYVRLVHDDAHEDVQKSHFINKGQWLIPLGRDSYLGLARDGVKLASGSEWIELTRQGLAEEIKQSKAKECESLFSSEFPSFESLITNLLELHQKLNRLEDWRIDHYRTSEIPEFMPSR